jgi:hypothetical protein
VVRQQLHHGQPYLHPVEPERNRAGRPGRHPELLQAPAPLPGRREELAWLGKVRGLSSVFGDEVPALIKDLTETAAEDVRRNK